MNERTGTVGLPLPPAPVAAFEPYVRHGAIYISGQVASRDGRLVAAGRLGAEVDLVAGQDAARACAVNVLAQLVKLTVFVACAGDFVQQPQVADGASQLLLDVLGAAGAHARSAIGVAALPLGTPVEVEAIAQVSTGATPEEAQPR
jgi:enamine deaminase RidA (YjgF/YER057c/UK114 family)